MAGMITRPLFYVFTETKYLDCDFLGLNIGVLYTDQPQH